MEEASTFGDPVEPTDAAIKQTASESVASPFTFQFPLPSAPSVPPPSNSKRKQSRIESPTPPSSPAKRARVDINASVNISPLTFAAAKNPSHLPNVLAERIPEPDLFSSTPFSPPTAYGWSDLEDNEDNLEETLSSPPDLAPPVVSGPKSKITSFWKIATQIEKEETNQREFQKLRDDFEVKAADIAEGNRQKLARGRMQARERQQAHRDRSKEKKMEAGWVPGEKRVISFYNPS